MSNVEVGDKVTIGKSSSGGEEPKGSSTSGSSRVVNSNVKVNKTNSDGINFTDDTGGPGINNETTQTTGNTKTINIRVLTAFFSTAGRDGSEKSNDFPPALQEPNKPGLEVTVRTLHFDREGGYFKDSTTVINTNNSKQITKDSTEFANERRSMETVRVIRTKRPKNN